MKCLKCDGEKFARKHVRFTSEIKSSVVETIVESFVCESCQTPLMDSAMMNELRRAAADQYRIEHSLLTSQQIRDYRDSLGMSQTLFARYLNVGEASVKRWETYFVQDASQDDHIRIKCDEAYAEMNYLDVRWKKSKPDIYSGNRRFSFDIFKNVALFLLESTNESIIKLNKLHFFVDFLHFKRFGESLTGARYVPLKYGPCPDQYRALYECLESIGVISKKNGQNFNIIKRAETQLFDDREIETLNYIVQLHHQRGGEYLYQLSHRERGFIETKECDLISYDYAKELQI